jgi:ABC-type nitrate/sulfonate/bicarbonate transport system permease component
VRRVARFRTRFAQLPEARQRRLARLTALVVVVVLWEVTGRLLGTVMFAPLSVVVPTLVDLVAGGRVLPALASTVVEMALGFALAVVTGVPVGYLMGRSRTVERSLNPVVGGLLVTSTSAMLPLLLVLFGIGLKLRLVVVWLACVAHLSLSVYHGVRGVDRRYLDVSRAFGVPTAMHYRRVLLPATLPSLAAGLRLGVGRAIQGIVLIETYTLVGYGGLVYQAGTGSVSTAPVLALVLLLMGLAYGLRLAVDAATRALVPWTDTAGDDPATGAPARRPAAGVEAP